jgi:hypothetical protein
VAYFLNSYIEDLDNNISQYSKQLKSALYEQYKLAYCLVRSPNFSGGSADAYKKYIEQVSIYFINSMLNISDEMGNASKEIKKVLLEYEKDHMGAIDQDTLEYLTGVVNGKRNTFIDTMDRYESVHRRAAKHISPVIPSVNNVDNLFKKVVKNFSTINTDINKLDSRIKSQVEAVSVHASTLLSKIQSLQKTYIKMEMIDLSAVDKISKESWYKPESGDILLEMWCADPFIYEVGQGAVWEEQWAVGLTPDVYAAAGAGLLTGEYEMKYMNGVFEVSAKGSVVNGYAEAQFTDFLKASAEAYLLGASGSAKVGWSDEYIGFKLEGEASVAKAKGKIILGTDEFNGYVKGEAKVLSADGFAAAEFEDKNNYDIGIGGSATLAEASGEIGLSFLKVKSSGSGESKNLFGLSGKAKASAGVGAGVRLTSENVYDGSIVDINTVSVNVNLKAIIGVELSVTVPQIKLFGLF